MQNVTCSLDNTWEAPVSIPQAGEYHARVQDALGFDDATITVVEEA